MNCGRETRSSPSCGILQLGSLALNRCAVAIVRGDVEGRLLAQGHLHDALIPALDH